MDLTLADFVCGILIGAGAIVGLASLISRYRNGRAERRAIRQRVVCRLCLHAFQDHNRGAGLVNCPECAAANETRR